jgi:hypothetical protein
MLRRGKEVTVGLACRPLSRTTSVVFMPPSAQHHYESAISGWLGYSCAVSPIFPGRRAAGIATAAAACRGITVERRCWRCGAFREAGVLGPSCELCDRLPELIAPAHVGLFSRRVTAHFHLRPPNLIHRLEELRQERINLPG